MKMCAIFVSVSRHGNMWDKRTRNPCLFLKASFWCETDWSKGERMQQISVKMQHVISKCLAQKNCAQLSAILYTEHWQIKNFGQQRLSTARYVVHYLFWALPDTHELKWWYYMYITARCIFFTQVKQIDVFINLVFSIKSRLFEGSWDKLSFEDLVVTFNPVEDFVKVSTTSLADWLIHIPS